MKIDRQVFSLVVLIFLFGLSPGFSSEYFHISPNPFYGSNTETVAFSGIEPQNTILIYDLEKKLVLALNAPADGKSLPWNIKGDQGQELPAGVYVVVIKSPGGSERRSIFLNRVGKPGLPLVASSRCWGPAEFAVSTHDPWGNELAPIPLLLLEAPILGYQVNGAPKESVTILSSAVSPDGAASTSRVEVNFTGSSAPKGTVVVWGETPSLFPLKQAKPVGNSIEIRTLSSANQKVPVTVRIQDATHLRPYQFLPAKLIWTEVLESHPIPEQNRLEVSIAAPCLLQLGLSTEAVPALGEENIR